MKHNNTPLPSSIGKPATRALNQQGYFTLEQVAGLSDAKLLSLHGLGPKAIRILRLALKEQGSDLQTNQS